MDRHDELSAAMIRASETEFSGALVVSGGEVSATLYFDRGRVCFGRIHGEECIPADGGGIEPLKWLTALASPIADLDFSAALLLSAAPVPAVSQFARNSIDRSIELLEQSSDLEIRWTNRTSPFGSGFRFDVSNWTESGTSLPAPTG